MWKMNESNGDEKKKTLTFVGLFFTFHCRYSQRNHIQSKSYAMIADKSATTEHESKIYNVTSKKDGVTWGDEMKSNRNQIELQHFVYFCRNDQQRYVRFVDRISDDEKHLASSAQHDALSFDGILFSHILPCNTRHYVRLFVEIDKKSTPIDALVSKDSNVYGQIEIFHDTRMAFRQHKHSSSLREVILVLTLYPCWHFSVRSINNPFTPFQNERSRHEVLPERCA